LASEPVSKKDKFKNFTKIEMSPGSTFDFELSNIDFSDSFENIQSISRAGNLFLGRFRVNDLLNMIESIGLKKHLSLIGFNNLIADVYKDENYINYLRLYSNEISPENQLVDLRVSENTFIADKKFFESEEYAAPYNIITIEWLSAKNPLIIFDEKKPQLPGQANPGLGVLKYCFKLLYIMAKDVYKDGFLDIPTHMHGAIMYSKKFKFFDPVHEGILRAVMRDLRKYSLADISWGVITQTIIDKNKNEPAVYDPCEQIHYVSNRMRQYFKSKKYRETFRKFYNKKKYYLDYNEMVKRRAEILKTKAIEDL